MATSCMWLPWGPEDSISHVTPEQDILSLSPSDWFLFGESRRCREPRRHGAVDIVAREGERSNGYFF